MTLTEYIQELDRQYRTGLAREHSYRPALQQLLATLLPQLTVTNEPARIACGAPDFIVTRKADALPVAFLEAKDIDDPDLDGRKQHREQFERYRSSLSTIVFTDYLDFHLYEQGELKERVRLAETGNGRIRLKKDNEAAFLNLVRRLGQASPQPITSASRLALTMAAKARLLAATIQRSFDEENQSYEGEQLRGQMEAIKKVLIHDITPAAFADIYAQTIAYGMFAARLHDPTPDTFSRQEAATLIPKTNPFLRQIFQSIAGYDLDERIAWIVDDLAAAFQVTDVAKVMHGYAASGQHTDPMIHFYEDFLSAYSPKLRKSKGVWYTPQPVVQFIVRAVDEILVRDFQLPMGLADYSTVEREVKNEQYEKGRKGEKPTVRRQFHRVQILDPATGTGTFLAEVVRKIYAKFRGQEGLWQNYVAEHLLCRLNGFELLMASYAIAHLKLDMLLSETGYTHQTNSRLRVYLTNSLEECHPDTGSLFAQWLSREANEANRIKRDTPVMVMLGNPPYNGSSTNKGEWIMRLMDDYKCEPGGEVPLKERNPKWLNDDYVKFLRMAQDYITRNGSGLLAFINPHGYLDNPTFRGMRWNLLRTYDEIYALNLHGNSKKKETCPDGSKDENVFDIMQGVSVNIFVKTGRKRDGEPARVHYADLYGLRQRKYDFLSTTSLFDVAWQELQPKAPMYFFVPKDFEKEEEYNAGFGVQELFDVSSVGIVTTKDDFDLCGSRQEVERRISDLINWDEGQLREVYHLEDTRDWTIRRAKEDVGKAVDVSKIRKMAYRPFDTKFLYYTGASCGIVARPRCHTMRHLLNPANLAIVVSRQCTSDWRYVFVTDTLCDLNLTGTAGRYGAGYAFPLYVNKEVGERDSLFSDTGAGTSLPSSDAEVRRQECRRSMQGDELTPNFRPEILRKIEARLGEKIVPQELFGYIYAVLHSPRYRERYKELLKIDFPRIPYPASKQRYHELAGLGAELVRLHLMQDADCWQTGVSYPVSGSNEVTQPRFVGGRVHINEAQYFGGVPEETWNFYVGGYQPAQKWLKDRKGRQLSFADIRHYEQVIFALNATRRIMCKIDAT